MRYLLYLLTHKWHVFRECWNAGIWWWGLLHDLSSFLPSEFLTTRKYYIGKKGCQYHPRAFFNHPDFDLVRLHHHRRNGHHWQHWVLILDPGKMRPVEMPRGFLKEMWCDWVVVDRLQGNDLEEWVRSNLSKMVLHPRTRAWIEARLEELKCRQKSP